jgi:hypothetical protein
MQLVPPVHFRPGAPEAVKLRVFRGAPPPNPVRGSQAVLGGTFGTERVAGGLARNVLLKLQITRSARFHCRTPAATLGLQDLPSVKGNSDGIDFHACGAELQWTGKTPALVVKIAPAIR